MRPQTHQHTLTHSHTHTEALRKLHTQLVATPPHTHAHTHMLSYSAQLLLLLPLHNIIMMLLNRQAQGGGAGRQAGRQGTRLKGSSHTACAHCESTIKPHFTLMIRQTDSQTERQTKWRARVGIAFCHNFGPKLPSVGCVGKQWRGVGDGGRVIASPNWIIMLICTYWERQVPRPQIAAIKKSERETNTKLPKLTISFGFFMYLVRFWFELCAFVNCFTCLVYS